MDRIFIFFQHLLPQHLLSRCIGFLADLSRPNWLKNRVIALYVRYYGVPMEEAREPDFRRYESFNAFFTRPLLDAARPRADADILCPADGVFSQLGDIEEDLLLQAKGRRFSTVDLLGGDSDRARDFRAGHFTTIYLSPRDYHRVHMPVTGKLVATTYIPGKLFSVNAVTARHVDRLFARNERLVCYFATAVGPMAMVLVGAMIVAGIETVWSGRVTPARRGPETVDYAGRAEPVELDRGQEMGRFFLGSTVILLFPPGSIAWRRDTGTGSLARVGERLGDFTRAGYRG